MSLQTFQMEKLNTENTPSKRGNHTANVYRNSIYIFGGEFGRDEFSNGLHELCVIFPVKEKLLNCKKYCDILINI